MEFFKILFVSLGTERKFDYLASREANRIWKILESIQPRRIAAIHGIVAAIAVEIARIPFEPDRVRLHESPQAGLIDAVPVIVDRSFSQIIATLEKKPVRYDGIQAFVTGRNENPRVAGQPIGVAFRYSAVIKQVGHVPATVITIPRISIGSAPS